jgi:hypothetical protein
VCVCVWCSSQKLCRSFTISSSFTIYAPYSDTQVRNLRSCLKVAADFVSPEAMQQCLGMASRLRTCFKLEQVCVCVCLCLGMANRLRTCFKLEQVCVFVFGHGQPAAHVLQARAGVCVCVCVWAWPTGCARASS